MWFGLQTYKKENVKFKSHRISISDEELGCTITFYEKEKESYTENSNVQKTINSIGTYLMLQRTYPEDEFETDYYYIELSDFEKSGELSNFKIELNKNKFGIVWESEKAEIELSISELDFEKLKEALRIITNDIGQLTLIEWKVKKPTLS